MSTGAYRRPVAPQAGSTKHASNVPAARRPSPVAAGSHPTATTSSWGEMGPPPPPPLPPMSNRVAPGPATALTGTAPTPSHLDDPGKVNFLLEIAARLDREGNAVEAVKSLETALLLRRSFSEESTQGLFPDTLAKQAQSLVLRCNALGVQSFQMDEYDAAGFYLSKAMFLTDETASTNCFLGHDHDRLRLRASTYNNIGCMEKKRGHIPAALTCLQKAVEVETLVDPDLGAAPSTYLNLCTVLNKVGQHDQAAVAAERAVRALRVQAQSGGSDRAPAFVNMTISAYYNLGLSIEYSGRPMSLNRAADAYSNCIVAAFKLANVTAATDQTVSAAQRALTRLGQPLPVLTVPSVQPVPSLALTSLSDSSRPGSTPVAGQTPRPPIARGLPEPQQRPNTVGAPGGNRIENGIAAHTARIKAKQRRKEEAVQRSQQALQRAQLAHDKEKAEKLRKERELAAKEREEMARQLYQQMESGMRADRIRQLNSAATRIQCVWRGYLVRDYLQDMLRSTVRIQAVVRSHLTRVHIREAASAEENRARLAAKLSKEHEAAKRIQRLARCFLRRLICILSWKVRVLRRHHSAKKIQRAYAMHRNRIELRILAKIEAERKAEQRRVEKLNESAKRIQRCYRTYKSRRFMRIVRMQQIRRNAAATKIQAIVRGLLTRAWFRHYRVRRREQELSTAANLKLILVIQRAWRMAVAYRARRRKHLSRVHQERQHALFKAARSIQCAYRSHVARSIMKRRRARGQLRERGASSIQRWWTMLQQRRAYRFRRDEHRRMRKLIRLQRWWRHELRRQKEMETAKYHSEQLRREKLRLARTHLALILQASGRQWLSDRLVGMVRKDFMARSRISTTLQKTARGYRARRDTFTMKRLATLVDAKARRRAQEQRAAMTIQRSVRVAQAKDRVVLRRRQMAAAIRIQSGVRMLLAKRRRQRLEKIKTDAIRESAARKIQRSVRLFLRRRELYRLEEYYVRRRQQKLLEQRRVEASICIQAHWRGYATRQATLIARQEIMHRTLDAVRIQRAYRTHLFRCRLDVEFAKRRRRRNRHADAALRIQCFWRRVLATDYVALLKQRRFDRTVAAIVIQCGWRCMRARVERRYRQERRRQIRLLTAARHDRCVTACTVVNMHARTVLQMRRRLVRLEVSLTQLVEGRKYYRERYINGAATRIQKVYRGHYERCYVRGVRREYNERQAKIAAERQRKHRAALRIQCCVRVFRAKKIVGDKRLIRAMDFAAAEAAKAEKADPKSLVRQLFWAHEAATRRNVTAERRNRTERQDAAIVHIQRLVRGFLARRRVKRHRKLIKEAEAAAEIQHAWRDHRVTVERSNNEKRAAAATRIQSVARMFLVRRSFRIREAKMRATKNASAVQEERRDRAATSIQACWRGWTARQRHQCLLNDKKNEQSEKRRFEAARLIQKNWRRWLAQRYVVELRCRRNNLPIPPRPPRARRVAPGSRVPSAPRAPQPPPRRPSGAASSSGGAAFRRSSVGS